MTATSSGSKPPLLYLPGIDGTGELLFRQMENLSRDYRVLTVSYPQDRKVTYEELAERGAAKLDENDVRRPAVVLAESFGGAVAITFALRHPERVKQMCLVNTFARFPRRIMIRFASWVSFLAVGRSLPRWTINLRGKRFFDNGVSPAEQGRVWEITSVVPMQAYGRRVRMLAKVNLLDKLPSITIPTLVLTAPNDRVVPPQGGREIAELMPNARLIEKPVGHAALIHPDVNVAELLADARLRDTNESPAR